MVQCWLGLFVQQDLRMTNLGSQQPALSMDLGTSWPEVSAVPQAAESSRLPGLIWLSWLSRYVLGNISPQMQSESGRAGQTNFDISTEWAGCP